MTTANPMAVGEVRRCDCGAESPALIPDAADVWEDDHAQWSCPIDTSAQWDDVLERWYYPRFPGFTRRPAPLDPIPTRQATGSTWPRTRLRILLLRAYLDRVLRRQQP